MWLVLRTVMFVDFRCDNTANANIWPHSIDSPNIREGDITVLLVESHLPPTMTSTASLRDLYNTRSTSWKFNEQMPSAGPSKPSSSAPAWSTVPPQNNPIFDLAPMLDYGGGSENATTKAIFKALISSAFLQYTTTAIAMPWEVGKILLQIQWIPKDPEGEVEEDETVQYADQESVSDVFPFPFACCRLADDVDRHG